MTSNCAIERDNLGSDELINKTNAVDIMDFFLFETGLFEPKKDLALSVGQVREVIKDKDGLFVFEDEGEGLVQVGADFAKAGLGGIVIDGRGVKLQGGKNSGEIDDRERLVDGNQFAGTPPVFPAELRRGPKDDVAKDKDKTDDEEIKIKGAAGKNGQAKNDNRDKGRDEEDVAPVTEDRSPKTNQNGNKNGGEEPGQEEAAFLFGRGQKRAKKEIKRNPGHKKSIGAFVGQTNPTKSELGHNQGQRFDGQITGEGGPTGKGRGQVAATSELFDQGWQPGKKKEGEKQITESKGFEVFPVLPEDINPLGRQVKEGAIKSIKVGQTNEDEKVPVVVLFRFFPDGFGQIKPGKEGQKG